MMAVFYRPGRSEIISILNPRSGCISYIDCLKLLYSGQGVPMKLVPMKIEDIPERKRKESPYRQILDQFTKSGQDAARLEGLKTKTNTAVAQLRRYVKQGNLDVVIRVADGEIYLVREEKERPEKPGSE
jgi:hypothetical protein